MGWQKMLSQLHFEVVDFLGQGSYGKVVLAKSKLYTNQVAIKIMDCRKMSEEDASVCLSRELKIIKQIRHPHIVEVHETFKTRKGLVFIVMEPAAMNLMELLVKEETIPVHQAKSWFAQLVSAMVYLHDKDIVHRDLKCDNILLTSDNKVKLTDFSFVHKSRGFPDLCDTYCGTIPYTAPEVLKNQAYDAKKSDVWSLGVILYTMVIGQLPFHYEEEIVLDRQCKPLKFPPQVDETLRSFILYMLQYDPLARPSVTEVALHPWLQTKASRSDGESSRESLLPDYEPVQASDISMESVSSNDYPDQSKNKDSWSSEDSLLSATAMRPVSRNVQPDQSGHEDPQPSGDSWPPGTAMRSVNINIHSDQSGHEDPRPSEDSWSSGTTIRSISGNVYPEHSADEDPGSSAMCKAEVLLGAEALMKNVGVQVNLETSLTCPTIEVVAEEEEFGCFSPLSAAFKKAAKACAKALAPVRKASKSLRGRIKKFFKRTK